MSDLKKFIKEEIVKLRKIDLLKEQKSQIIKKLNILNENIEGSFSNNHKLIDSFVSHLPTGLPALIKIYMEKLGEGYDSAFFFLIGTFIYKFGKKFGPKKADILEDLTNNDDYEEYFFDKLDEKYGKHVIEW